MTRTLILIRHCKSDWSANQEDHARPLNPRGRRAAPRLGAFLAAEGLAPDEVLCSDAMRTRETWAGIASQLPDAPAPTLSRTLYLADPAAMLTAIRAGTGTIVAVIGHNPGIGELAWSLAEKPPHDERFGMYPTGATTVLRVGAPWSDLTTGEVTHFTTPRDLPDPG
ncbi:histidine phosphatase family protein [Gymnodinialimonas hymeniacidonis]|uniref:SixA phosphatase family protein n=1 Tax=Gymnodinialimonas hymeniacidonis TaxID=3126508 RepID=UPI0034C626C2